MALGNYRGPSSYKAFTRYATALLNKKAYDLSYRVYVTDMLQSIPQMQYFTTRWIDTVESRGKGKPARSAEEIIDSVIESLGGEA